MSNRALLFVYFNGQSFCLFFFFFQAEDGIRDVAVTGVQTCALPISGGTKVLTRSYVLRLGPRVARKSHDEAGISNNVRVTRPAPPDREQVSRRGQRDNAPRRAVEVEHRTVDSNRPDVGGTRTPDAKQKQVGGRCHLSERRAVKVNDHSVLSDQPEIVGRRAP